MKVAELCSLLNDARDTSEKIWQILKETDPSMAVAMSTMELTAYRNVIHAMAEFIEEMEVM